MAGKRSSGFPPPLQYNAWKDSQRQLEEKTKKEEEQIFISLPEQIERTRDKLELDGGTILFSHILLPVAAHGSHLIFAPDEVFWHLACQVWSLKSAAVDTAQSVLSRGSENFRAMTWESVPSRMRNNMDKCFILLSLMPASYIFHYHGAALKCQLQNTFVGWADWNREVGALSRFVSISGMMSARMIISNILPFTSPAFAYLIAKSQPEGQEWAGTFFLLACSMPAGALVPLLDKLAEIMFRKKFLITSFAGIVTDHMPFTFWVRPCIMEPAYRAAKHAKLEDTTAASAAVLAGHFMIWAGPPTTMHQRNFVPDWITCVLMQPLGLMEDVAVVLATWAGATATSQKQAQIALYGFMLLMNLVRFAALKNSNRRGQSPLGVEEADCLQRAPNPGCRHAMVAILTIIFAVVRFQEPVIDPVAIPTTTVATTLPCATDPSNVGAIFWTIATVSVEALAFSLTAKLVALSFAALMKAWRPTKPHDIENPLLA